jgi:hypothetical protein
MVATRDFLQESRDAVLEAIHKRASKDPVFSAALSKAAKARIAMDEALVVIRQRAEGLKMDLMGPDDKIKKQYPVDSNDLVDAVCNNPDFLSQFGASRSKD